MTSQSTTGWELTNYCTHHQVSIDIWVSPHLANYQPTVDQMSSKNQSSVSLVSIKDLTRCQSNVDLGSNKSIDQCSNADTYTYNTHDSKKENETGEGNFFSPAVVALTSSSSFLKFRAGKRLPFPRKNPVLPRNPLSPSIPSVRSLCSFQLYTVKSASNSVYLKDNVPAG